MKLAEEIEAIIFENKHKITNAAIIEIVWDLSSMICEELALEFDMPYEEVESKIFVAQHKMKLRLDEMRENAS